MLQCFQWPISSAELRKTNKASTRRKSPLHVWSTNSLASPPPKAPSARRGVRLSTNQPTSLALPQPTERSPPFHPSGRVTEYRSNSLLISTTAAGRLKSTWEHIRAQPWIPKPSFPLEMSTSLLHTAPVPQGVRSAHQLCQLLRLASARFEPAPSGLDDRPL